MEFNEFGQALRQSVVAGFLDGDESGGSITMSHRVFADEVTDFVAVFLYQWLLEDETIETIVPESYRKLLAAQVVPNDYLAEPPGAAEAS